MNAIKFVWAFVLLTLSGFALADSVPKYVLSIEKQERAAWTLACAFKAYDCSRILPPQVWYMNIPGTHGRYYRGAPGIEINIRLIGQSFAGFVMIHEMVHYIQHAQIMDSPQSHGYQSHCARESEAFNITLAVAYSLDYSDARLAAWPEMAGAYGCSFSRPSWNTR